MRHKIHLDARELDELAAVIAEGVDGVDRDDWDKAHIDYRVEFTDGAVAAVEYINKLIRERNA